MDAARLPGPGPETSGDGDEAAGRLSRRAVLQLGGRTAAAVGLGGVLGLGGCCGLLEDEETRRRRRRMDGRGTAADPAGSGAGSAAADARTPAGDRGRQLYPPPTTEPIVRVRIGTVPAGEEVVLGRTGEELIAETGDRLRPDARNAAPAPPSPGDGRLIGPVRIGHDGNGWWWRDGAGRRGRWDADGPTPAIGRRPAPGSDALPVQWNRTPWPGRLQCIAGRVLDDRGDSAGDRDGDAGPRPPVHVIALVPMERYVPGVLARELFGGWHPATFEAQAIAARSFATFELLDRRARVRRAAGHWDVESDQRSQVFAGVTTLPRALAAGAATAGRVLTYGGWVLPAYFSSTCGGIGTPARVAVGPAAVNDLPPLQGHALDCCRSAPRYRWSAVRSLIRVQEQLRRWGVDGGPRELREIGRIRAFRIADRTSLGRPLSYDVLHIGAGGKREGELRRIRLPGPGLRRALQAGRLPEEDPVWSAFLEPTVERSRRLVRVAGRGWGHGAGLCQYGAQAMAAADRSAADILAAYFPGAEIRSAWGAPPA